MLSKAFTASVTRFLMMQTHYRSIMDFSEEAILAAEKGCKRLMKSFQTLTELETGKLSTLDIAAWRDNCYEAMNDDFNTPILISHLFEGVRFINLLKDKSASLTAADLDLSTTLLSVFVYDVLGLGTKTEASDAKTEKLNGTINLLIEMRDSARADHNYLLSDQLRDRLALLDIMLKDAKDGTTFKY